ncbi:uncharacterized protein LOC114749836 [Neltuma alba]|uniref:uncharacterized protein LOC114749836 n=1 Tax=Neltuma alba TaxID=207710 RepID=UPI0010A584BB|nr:uncharacterized protein LOC114749836 [Prosopis alba]
MMVQSLLTRSAMTGVKGLKIIILRQQRLKSSCICHRKMRLRAILDLEQLGESRDYPSFVLPFYAHRCFILASNAGHGLDLLFTVFILCSRYDVCYSDLDPLT